MKALFIGAYPNSVDIYMSVFFRNLIYQFADLGIECHVISPVSITKYRDKINDIPEKTTNLTKNGNELTIYYPKYVSYSAKKILGWNTMHLTQKSYEAIVYNTAKKIDEGFDFVYGHFILGGGLAAINVGRRLNIPSFIAYGECDYKSEVSSKIGKISSKRINGLTGIISVSSKNSKELEKNGFSRGVPLIMRPNAVDTTLFNKKDKVACRNKLGIPQDIFVVGFVGYFIERKGYNRLIEACQDVDDVYLAFAGKGEETPTGNNIVFCSSLNHEDVSTFLNAIDVFVLPTLNEGSCNAIVEAMACGKPVISSDLPFNYDVMTDDNSIRINPLSVEEIRSSIIKLKTNNELRNSLSDKAYLDAQKLNIRNRSEEILTFIKDCIKESTVHSD